MIYQILCNFKLYFVEFSEYLQSEAYKIMLTRRNIFFEE